jgi:threonine/homoserine/homoserine lactone efflux protein
MPEPHTFVLFAAASLAFIAVPGPSVIYIVSRSLAEGRRAGIVSALGIQTGGLVHVLAATIGVSALLASSAVAFSVVKYAGAAYLISLGLRKLLAGETPEERAGEPVGRRRLYWQGVVVNSLNPKTALFFLAFLPQFVDTSRGSASAQILVLGLLFAVLGLFSDAVYAVAAAAARDRLLSNPRLARWRARFTGVVFIALGVTAALTGRRSTG